MLKLFSRMSLLQHVWNGLKLEILAKVNIISLQKKLFYNKDINPNNILSNLLYGTKN